MILQDKTKRWKCRHDSKGIVVVDPRVHSQLLFRAGVDRIFASKLQHKLGQKNLFHCRSQPLEIMRGDAANNRWTVSEDGEVLMAEKKDVVEQINMALVAHDYDIRLNIATEIPADVVSAHQSNTGVPPIDTEAWIIERRKKRSSYTCKEASKWRIDFTEVDATHRVDAHGRQRKDSKELELEFELERQVMIDWLKERDPSKVIATTRVIAQELAAIIDYCIPSETGAEKEQSLAVVEDADYVYEVAFLTARLRGLSVPSREEVHAAYKRRAVFDFIGCMPVNLTRHNLIELQQPASGYFVTEKSDGVRYLLYVIPDIHSSSSIALLVDRSTTMYRFRECELVGRVLGAGTVLDGELVFNRSFKENVFLVFDVLVWRGIPRVEDDFQLRHDLIRTSILPAYEDGIQRAIKGNESGSTIAPLRLIRKAFVSSRELSTLLGKMTLLAGEHVFFDTDRRHHRSDGLIFQPNAKYVFSRHFQLLKWKWPELRTVDLKVVQEEVELPLGGQQSSSSAARSEWVVYLYCTGPDQVPINCTKRGDVNVGLGEFDTYRLLGDIENSPYDEKRKGASSSIVEVAYDVHEGMWSYVQLRRDKASPNFIDTVLGVFMEQAEAINIEELEYALNAAAHGLENDYEVRLAKMKTQLLDWQRGVIKKGKK